MALCHNAGISPSNIIEVINMNEKINEIKKTENSENSVKMEKMEKMNVLVDKAVSGDKGSLEELITGVRDSVFNLSLRMLGTIHDAEDATQEILLKVITHLSSFRKESLFTTWVFRIAYNHLKDVKESMFSKRPLSFEYYGYDIEHGRAEDMPDMTRGVDRSMLEHELKLSCTNVMLQCLDAESRCIFILGTMFKADSRIAGEILGLSPEAYRQRLSRIRKRVANFLSEYCGLSGTGMCSCKNRINYAIASHRLDPDSLEYSSLKEDGDVFNVFISAMDEIDDMSLVFSSLPAYRTTVRAQRFLEDFLQSDCYSTVANS